MSNNKLHQSFESDSSIHWSDMEVVDQCGFVSETDDEKSCAGLRAAEGDIEVNQLKSRADKMLVDLDLYIEALDTFCSGGNAENSTLFDFMEDSLDVTLNNCNGSGNITKDDEDSNDSLMIKVSLENQGPPVETKGHDQSRHEKIKKQSCNKITKQIQDNKMCTFSAIAESAIDEDNYLTNVDMSYQNPHFPDYREYNLISTDNNVNINSENENGIPKEGCDETAYDHMHTKDAQTLKVINFVVSRTWKLLAESESLPTQSFDCCDDKRHTSVTSVCNDLENLNISLLNLSCDSPLKNPFQLVNVPNNESKHDERKVTINDSPPVLIENTKSELSRGYSLTEDENHFNNRASNSEFKLDSNSKVIAVDTTQGMLLSHEPHTDTKNQDGHLNTSNIGENCLVKKSHITLLSTRKAKKNMMESKDKSIKRPPLVYTDIVDCKRMRITTKDTLVSKCDTNVDSKEKIKINHISFNTVPNSQVDQTKTCAKDELASFASMNQEKAQELRKSLKASVLKRRKYRLKNSSKDEEIDIEMEPGNHQKSIDPIINSHQIVPQYINPCNRSIIKSHSKVYDDDLRAKASQDDCNNNTAQDSNPTMFYNIKDDVTFTTAQQCVIESTDKTGQLDFTSLDTGKLQYLASQDGKSIINLLERCLPQPLVTEAKKMATAMNRYGQYGCYNDNSVCEMSSPVTVPAYGMSESSCRNVNDRRVIFNTAQDTVVGDTMWDADSRQVITRIDYNHSMSVLDNKTNSSLIYGSQTPMISENIRYNNYTGAPLIRTISNQNCPLVEEDFRYRNHTQSSRDVSVYEFGNMPAHHRHIGTLPVSSAQNIGVNNMHRTYMSPYTNFYSF